MALLQWGTEAQKQRFLVPQAKGEKYAAFGLTEPGAGSDVVSMQTSAKRRGETSILVRAAGQVASVTVGVIGPPVEDYPKIARDNFIDEFVFEKLRNFLVAQRSWLWRPGLRLRRERIRECRPVQVRSGRELDGRRREPRG